MRGDRQTDDRKHSRRYGFDSRPLPHSRRLDPAHGGAKLDPLRTYPPKFSIEDDMTKADRFNELWIAIAEFVQAEAAAGSDSDQIAEDVTMALDDVIQHHDDGTL